MFASLRRACSRALGGAVLVALLVSACGGGDSADPSSSSSKVTVAGADGASVTFDERNVAAKSGRTVRVARNASGAPQLPSNAVPVGGIYEFTPLGLIAPGVEIRVPFNADALPGGTRPQLLVAAPGEPWTQVRAARVEGAAMVARVHRLTHAVVVAVPEVRSGGLLKQAFGSGDAYSPLVQVAVASSSPALPAPDAEGVVPVTQPTTMALRATYELPAQCTERRQITVAVHGIELDANGEQVGESATVLAEFLATSPSGELSVPYEFAAGRRGVYFTMIRAVCINGIEFTFAGMNGFVFQVDTTTSPAPAPVISVAPQDRSVIEGDTATFAVEATGANLTYQWQRSNDGGQTYSPVAGTGASLSFVASLADHGSLWRVLVNNDAGTTTSTPGLLSVAQRVVAPAVTSDPSNQTVLEGETASFTVVGTGTPAPAIEWQVRSAAVADPEAGWSVVAGATASTYTTAATTLSQSGAQYRAVLRNAGGTAASLPATLTVQRQVVAPAIVSAPQSQSVQESLFGAFSVSASGTTPLSYQWFRNGQAIVGATASEVLVYADPNDVGSTYQVTVQVSNAAGSVTSPAALMTVTAIPGTPVSAATGGAVQGPEGSGIEIPAGALAQDVTVTLRSIPAAGVPVPAGFEALGDAIDVQPATLSLSVDGVLTLPVPEELPEGRELAVLEFEPAATSGKLTQWLQKTSSSSPARAALGQSTNLRRLAASGQAVGAVSATAVSGTPKVICFSPQSIVDGFMRTNFRRGGPRQVGTVALGTCAGYGTLPPSDGLPVAGTGSCGGDEAQYALQPNNVSEPEYLSLKNRHVSCDQFIAQAAIVEENRSVSGTYRFLGNADIMVKRSIFGKPTALQKIYEFRFNVIAWTPDPSNTSNPNPTLSVGALVECSAQPSSATCTAPNNTASLRMSVGSSAVLTTTAAYGVTVPEGSLPFAYFSPVTTFVYSASGSPYAWQTTQGLNLSVSAPRLRCDVQLAHATQSGCVFDQAAAVYVLDRKDSTVAEAAEHIFEAQNLPEPRKAPGAFMLMPGTRAISDSSVRGSAALQRNRWPTDQDRNRAASCGSSNSLFATRVPVRQSTSCEANPAGCSCDEYPFASTYSGGAYDPDRTSVKRINHDHNVLAGGGRLSGFYSRERVIDLAQFPGDAGNRGDDFWVHVK
jgi:hypothetical protein